MTSNFTEDQAEKLRKHFDGPISEIDQEKSVDVLSLPSRKEKYNSAKQRKQKDIDRPVSNKEREKKDKRRRRVKFPLVRILLFLFFLLVILVTTYPIWIERLEL